MTRRPHGGSPLAHRDFALLWAGFFVSQLGSQMQVVAVSWQAWRLSGDPLALGVRVCVRLADCVKDGDRVCEDVPAELTV